MPIKKPLVDIPIDISSFKGEDIALTELDNTSADNSITRVYKNSKKEIPIFTFVGYWENQNENKKIRPPMYSYAGWEYYWIKEKELKPKNDLEKKIVFKEFLNENKLNRKKELVYYSYIVNGKLFSDEYRLRFYNFINVLTRQRSNAAVVRVSVPVTGDTTLENAEMHAEQFIKEFIPFILEFLPK